MAIGIYIHIPFCGSKCNYCDFNSHVSGAEERTAYVSALCREIESFGKGGEYCADTVFLGGGTPTVLESEQLVEILTAVKKSIKLSENCEITTECNPATINRAGFAVLKGAGFNRISIGMQSANNERLKFLGRIHTFEECRSCVIAAREAGFENLSVDLMFGLPEQSLEEWLDTLKEAVKLKPEHISCYALKVEEGTPFSKMKLNIADEDESFEMYKKCTELLADNGYSRYEISNFAKNGFESHHNIKYWKCNDFIGFGVGAYSCMKGERFANTASTREYIDNIKEGKSVVTEKIPLSLNDMMSEFVYLGLRMDRGISSAEFEERFNSDIFDIFGDELDKNIKRGTIIRNESMLKIAPEFIYVSNAILSDFV